MSPAPLELAFVYLTQCCTNYIVTSQHHCRSLVKNSIIALVLKFHFSCKMLPLCLHTSRWNWEITVSGSATKEQQFCLYSCDFTNAGNVRHEKLACHVCQQLTGLQVFGCGFCIAGVFYHRSCTFFVIFPPGSCIFNFKISLSSDLLAICNWKYCSYDVQRYAEFEQITDIRDYSQQKTKPNSICKINNFYN